MKTVVIAAVILVFIGAAVWWFIMHETMRDQGQWIGTAFGNAADSTIEMHALVDMGMVTRDRPRVDARGEPLWNDWIADHWDLRDASGNAVGFTRIGWSTLIDDDKTIAVPEFYVKYTLQKGGQYTFDFTPSVRVEKKRAYRWCCHRAQRTAEDAANGLQVGHKVRGSR